MNGQNRSTVKKSGSGIAAAGIAQAAVVNIEPVFKIGLDAHVIRQLFANVDAKARAFIGERDLRGLP